MCGFQGGRPELKIKPGPTAAIPKGIGLTTG